MQDQKNEASPFLYLTNILDSVYVHSGHMVSLHSQAKRIT